MKIDLSPAPPILLCRCSAMLQSVVTLPEWRQVMVNLVLVDTKYFNEDSDTA